MTPDIAITGMGAVRAPMLDALPEPVRARASRAERVTQLVLSAAAPALLMAGLAVTDGDPRPRMGIVLGTAFGCFLTNAAYQRRLAEGGPATASPRLFAATVSNAAAGELAIAYRLGGPGITLAAAGVAGLLAIEHAMDLLRMGQADVLVAGGMDAADETLGRWMSDGGGGVADEGAAMVVLETLDHVRRRGGDVLALARECSSGFDPEAVDGGPVSAAPFDVVGALDGLAPAATTVVHSSAAGHVASLELRRP